MTESHRSVMSRRVAVAATGTALGAAVASLWTSRSSRLDGRDGIGADDGVEAVMTPGARDSDLLPDVELLTQTGRPVRFYSDLIRDSRILLSFMYVRCQGTCPATSAMFSGLRKPVMQRLGPNVKFISITLDAEYDRPEVLQEYARHFGAEDERQSKPGYAPWYFLTGNPQTIERLRHALGHYDPDPVLDADRTQHASLFTFGNDTTNHWATMPTGIPRDQAFGTVVRFLTTSYADRYALLPRPA